MRTPRSRARSATFRTPLEPAPGAAIPGRTSKIKRFYWRELFFRETEAFADWEAAHPQASGEEAQAARKRIEREVLETIKALHASAPLYDMREPSQADVLARCDEISDRPFVLHAEVEVQADRVEVAAGIAPARQVGALVGAHAGVTSAVPAISSSPAPLTHSTA